MVDKVTLVGLKNNNLGDQVIFDTCKFLVEKVCPDAKIFVCDISPDKDLMKEILDTVNA